MIKRFKVITLCKFTKTKEMLDEMHKCKIDMTNEIFVINVNEYIGESRKSEIN